MNRPSMNPVTDERIRKCVRCKNRFVEPEDTVTRICDTCKKRGAAVYTDPTETSWYRR